ncbi:putative 2-acylglycerol O-acyltransferase [Lupinus albus]|uniref:Putative 2-acylglycerol O-acyltransferase n=1 Tax=Lupinus albus TaxID=3870 RepID=A0A6A4QCR6_LUPAL|nr:putative 2-acylglycerol O-acyltransferase [Lupinus albus]
MQISDDLIPNAMMVNILTGLSKVAPKWKIVPSEDMIEIGYKMPEVREQIRDNPYYYKGKPRLKTAHELLRTCTEIQQRLHEVTIPFLIVHGEEDRVTDTSVSKELYNVASSSDKTLKTYPGMWHGILYGEPPENLNIVFSDIINWLEDKTQYRNQRMEREQKEQNEALVKGKRGLVIL